MFDARGEEDVAFYPDSAWTNMLFGRRLPVRSTHPRGHAGRHQAVPADGARKHDLRTLFFYGYTGITPAMAMRLTGLGSQYLVAFFDSNGEYFDGAKSYTVTLPPDIRRKRGSGRSRSTTTRPARCSPRPNGSRRRAASLPSPAAVPNDDGSITVHFAPEQPDGVATATGSRRCRARASSRSCGSTARSSRSSTRRGGRRGRTSRPELRSPERRPRVDVRVIHREQRTALPILTSLAGYQRRG